MLQPPRIRAFPSARALLTVAIVTAIAGSLVAVAVSQGWTARFDEAMLFAIRGSGAGEKPFGPVWMHEAVRDVTALGSMTVLAFVVIGGASYFLASHRYRLGGLLIASSLAATAYSTGLKMLFDRPRPGLVTHEMATFTASFPSGHALLSAAILLTNGGLLAFAARQRNEKYVIGFAAVLLTGLVGLSRIFLGVHWPSDVIAGWLFGTVWASLTLLWARTFYPQPQSAY